jgi:4-hydroxybenzoate polyprenyltransferase
MNYKQILSFIKIEHTLFSLPFILIGYIIAHNQFSDVISADSIINIDLLWILVAAIGARGLAMTLNRIIDRDIDAANPRTASRHLASGMMSMNTAWSLAGVFLVMLLIGAGMLNEVALKMSWLPVLVFVIYPYTKRFTWLCHLWLGLCLGLAPAGAWLAIAGDVHGWDAILGTEGFGTGILWHPTILFLSLGVTFWITAFDINYARMDIDSDKENQIHSFPARFGESITTQMSLLLTFIWMLCFIISKPIDELYFIYGMALVAILNGYIVLNKDKIKDFQTTLFRASIFTGWIILLPIILIST